jgi:SHS2 domain-containing protein
MQAEMYEVFEHTADIGLHITAPSLEELFVEAAHGLFSLIVETPPEVRPVRRVEITLQAASTPYLLFDWLDELLFIFDTKRLILTDFRVQIHDDGSLTGEARGEDIDESRHRLEHEVKAITYHGLEANRTPDGWEARVIVDI